MNNVSGKLCVTLIILGCVLFAQETEPNIVWERIWGGDNADVLNCVQETSDGGYIVVGTTYSTPTNPDVYCSKRDNFGNLEWERILGGDYRDEGRYVIESQGGFIVVGKIDNGQGEEYVYLAKLNATDGGTVWQKAYDHHGWGSDDWGACVQEWYLFDAFVGYVIVGGTNTGGGLYNLYILFTTPNGTFYDERIHGGVYSDYGCFIQQTNYDPEPGLIIAGTTNTSSSGQVWLLKTDEYGDDLWDKTFGGPELDHGYCVREYNDGYAIVGTYQYDYVYLIETDFEGNENWTSLYTPPNSNSSGHSMKITSDGGYAITGISKVGINKNVLIMKADSDGNEEWMKVIDDRMEEGKCIDLVGGGNGGYIICGTRAYQFGGPYDFHLIKLGWWLAETNDPSAMSYNGNRHLARYQSTGELFLVYGDDGKIMFTNSTDDGANWLYPHYEVGQGSYPAITLDSDGLPSIVWEDDNGGLWYRRQTSPGGWSNLYHIYQPSPAQARISSPPSMVISQHASGDSVHILCTLNNPEVLADFVAEYSFRIDNPSGSFSYIESGLGQPIRLYPSITKLDSDNSLHAVWQRGDAICYAVRPISGLWNNWGPQFGAFGLQSAHPFVETAGSYINVVWQRREGFLNLEEVYKASRSSFNPFPRWTITPISLTPATQSQMPVNAKGNYTIFAEERIGGPFEDSSYEIYYNYVHEDYNISQHPYVWSHHPHTVAKIGSPSYLYTAYLEKTTPSHMPYMLCFKKTLAIDEAPPAGVMNNDENLTDKEIVILSPNPFKHTLNIIIKNKLNCAINVKIYDRTGRIVKAYKKVKQGLTWNGYDDLGKQVPAGIYFAQIETPNYTEVKKVILLK